MFSQEIIDFGRKPNVIRDLSAYAGKRKQEIGAENVFETFCVMVLISTHPSCGSYLVTTEYTCSQSHSFPSSSFLTLTLWLNVRCSPYRAALR